MPEKSLPAIALVAENVSLRMGGEAARPLHYFRALRARGVDAHIVTHARNQQELAALLPGEEERVHCVPDQTSQQWLWRLGLLLPEWIREGSTTLLIQLISQRLQRRVVSQLVRKQGVRIVHQVTPISPKAPSRMHGLGVSVVMGPMNGDMNYPPGFRSRQHRTTRVFQGVGRVLSHLVNWAIPGRRYADVLLVSNARTSRAVPRGCRGRKVRLVANAVDLSMWKPRDADPRREVPEFVFVGRLVDFKGVDLLLDAFRLVVDATPARLCIIGDGPLRQALEEHAHSLDLGDHVEFAGWLGPEAVVQRMRDADVFVFPSLRDPGGAVVMEAMCLGLPVVASDWGGPADYAGDGAGLLVGPRTKPQFVGELAGLMHRLATTPELRSDLGQRALARARTEFDWNHRVDRLLDVYRSLTFPPEPRSRRSRTAGLPGPPPRRVPQPDGSRTQIQRNR